jgi:hypothetical protein
MTKPKYQCEVVPPGRISPKLKMNFCEYIYRFFEKKEIQDDFLLEKGWQRLLNLINGHRLGKIIGKTDVDSIDSYCIVEAGENSAEATLKTYFHKSLNGIYKDYIKKCNKIETDVYIDETGLAGNPDPDNTQEPDDFELSEADHIAFNKALEGLSMPEIIELASNKFLSRNRKNRSKKFIILPTSSIQDENLLKLEYCKKWFEINYLKKGEEMKQLEVAKQVGFSQQESQLSTYYSKFMECILESTDDLVKSRVGEKGMSKIKSYMDKENKAFKPEYRYTQKKAKKVDPTVVGDALNKKNNIELSTNGVHGDV